MQTFLDITGLASTDEGRAALAQLAREPYPGLEEITEDERLDFLTRTVGGAGVRIITGPLGAPYWSLAGIEVIIEVWPDGYRYDYRSPSVLVWSLQVCGMAATDAVRLSRNPPKSARHRAFDVYQRAMRLADCFTTRSSGTKPLVTVPTPEVRDADILGQLDKERLYAMDWEWERETLAPLGLGIYPQGEAGVYIPTQTLASQLEVRAHWGKVLESGLPVVLHNGRSDLGTQYPDDPVALSGKSVIHDTIVLAYLAGESELGLAPLSRKYLGRELNKGIRDQIDTVPVETAARYCVDDCKATYELYTQLAAVVSSSGQWDVYENIEMPLVPVVASMEKYGVSVDVGVMLREYRATVQLEYAMRRALVDRYCVDPASDEGCREILTRELGFDPGTLDQRTLSMYPDGIVDLVLFYRQHRTRRRNFLKRHILRWVEAGKPDDFRMYPRYNQAGSFDEDGGKAAPRTGRFSSTDPNIQQQPASIREMFIAPANHLFWAYDFSGIELRLAAAVSGDRTMLAAINSGQDLHGLLRERVYELTGQHIVRTAAKRWNFGKLYLGQLDKLIQILAKERVHLDRRTAEALDAAHASLFPDYFEWTRDWIRECRELGYARTLRGRVRLLPELYSDDSTERGNAERGAVNMAVQGLAADIMKEAMVALVEVMARYDAHIAGTVHDEVFGWVPMDVDVDGFKRDVKEVMEGIEVPNVRLAVEGGTGRSWKDAK